MTDDTAANGHDPEIETAEEAAADEAEALRVEIAALKDQILRYAAEADNVRRRAEREANDARAFAIQKFARDLFAVADHLSAATTHAPRDVVDPTVRNFVVGVEMTEKELSSVFERNGLKRIEPAKGGKFDPHLHQAMMEQPGEGVAPGAVIKVLQPGYELFGRIVRPAMVVVASKTGAAEAAATAAANPYADADGADAGGSVDTKA